MVRDNQAPSALDTDTKKGFWSQKQWRGSSLVQSCSVFWTELLCGLQACSLCPSKRSVSYLISFNRTFHCFNLPVCSKFLSFLSFFLLPSLSSFLPSSFPLSLPHSFSLSFFLMIHEYITLLPMSWLNPTSEFLHARHIPNFWQVLEHCIFTNSRPLPMMCYLPGHLLIVLLKAIFSSFKILI